MNGVGSSGGKEGGDRLISSTPSQNSQKICQLDKGAYQTYCIEGATTWTVLVRSLRAKSERMAIRFEIRSQLA